MRLAAKILLGVIAGLVIIAVCATLILTRTDFGREYVRGRIVAALEGAVNGRVHVGSVSGNLLSGMTLTDVSITDSSGAPFLAAGEIEIGYALGPLFSKHLVLSDVRLVRPVIVLSQGVDGGDWNFQRLFGSDGAPPDTTFGWGDWIVIRDAEIVDGRVTVRRAWTPGDELSGAARDSAIAEALGGDGRSNVVRADGGFQQVMDFRSIDAQFPLLRLAHPDYDSRRIEVAALAMVAAPFRPPVVVVRDVDGVFEITGDSLWWNGVATRLEASAIAGNGAYVFDDGEIRLGLDGSPVALADLRWLYPPLPSTGQGTLHFAMTTDGDSSIYVARAADIQVRNTRLAGDFGLTITDTIAFHNTALTMSNLDTRLIEQLVPGLEIEQRGDIGGRLALAGGTHALRLDADLSFDGERSGLTHVIANGTVGFGDGAMRADALNVRLDPLQVALVESVSADLPIGGIVTGSARLDGSTAAQLAVRADLAHEDRGQRSHISGEGVLRLSDSTWIDIDITADPVALATVARFTPLDMHGAASGPIRLTGSLGDLAVDATLAVTDGGTIAVDGTLDLAGDPPGYDLALDAKLFDVSAILADAPRTSLTATATAVGRGFDPATMNARFTADASTSLYDSVAVDSAMIRVAISDGLLSVDSARLSAPGTLVSLAGDFGVAAGRTGELSYDVSIDSLDAFSRWMPPLDTGVVRPRPGNVARAIAEARADSMRVAKATEVERAITGGSPPKLVVDSPAVIRRDEISGSVSAEGMLVGSVERFDARGSADAEDLVVAGHSVTAARAEYALLDVGASEMAIVGAASVREASVGGFYFDSVEARVTHRYPGGAGTALVVIEQQSGQQYSAQTRYALHADHNEIHFDDLALHFDTTSWLATRPGTVKWGGRGVEVETLELRSGSTGRIYVDGLLPTEGIADFRIAVDNFEIANLINLVQSDIAASGLVSLEVNLAGTARAPVFEGAAGVIGGSYAGRTLPELHATFSYADRRLVANAVANRTGLPPIVVAEGTMPVNLALSGVGENESRIPDGTLSVDITMDSLPLDVLPPIEGAISNMAGTAAGTVTIRGTVDAPVVTGAIALSDASVRLDPVGVTLRRIAGAIRMDGETIFIDSIAGRSGGPVRVTGTLGLETLTEPSFDLALHADNARVLDNHLGEIVADAELKMTGPFRDVLIDGSATIDHGVLYVPESSSKKLIDLRDPTLVKIIDTSTVTLDEIAPPPSPLLENLRIDVALTVERDTWVRSPEANVEVYGDLEISMDQANEALIIEGLLSTDRGEYTVFSKRFELTRGSATFIGTPDPDPTLQLTGEFQVPRPGQEALTIRVLIGGTLGEPRISLESDAQPPIPESDLLSYVAFGRTSTSLLHETGGVGPAASLAGFSQLAARQLASSLLGVLVNEFEGDAARGLGADYINITPSGNPVDASVDRFDEFLSNTEIEVGKYTDPSTFVVLQARPRLVFPGVIVQHRVTPELRIEAGFGPRFLLPQPTLGEQSLDPFNALGLFLIREWRFSSPAPEAPTVAPPPTVDEDLEKARREASEGNPP